ncbi:transcriptional regulator [Microbacterium faecale]|uniref:Transcriptional regulator n=1 Tax=Microbacterium faecale TaxID=1804630 RepID=A0A916YFN8_9MICO|nr:winged helix-turn-helix transcriptional regulator [Microbacterium faecale]GGD42810.1 transcriptional regulator [Microbacterium faecale]
MATRRQYEDSCGMAQGLNIVGERWALLVVRELLLGPKRFSRLRDDLPGISPNVLSQRLTELESAGVLQRRRLAPPADAWVYELTEWGAALEPMIIELGRWAASSPFFDRKHGLSVTSAVLSQRTMFQPEAAAGERLSIVLKLGDQRFWAKVDDGQFSIEPGDATEPDATVNTDPVVLASVLYGGRDLTEAIEAQELEIEGDTRALERYLAMFWLPPAVSMTTTEEIRDMKTTHR